MPLRASTLIPGAVAVAGACVLAVANLAPAPQRAAPRLPGADNVPPVVVVPLAETGTLTRGDGELSDLPGSWPGFRGARLDGIGHEAVRLARSWGPSGPPRLWSVEVGEGYAGAAVEEGRVFVLDYDREAQKDALRCLSLQDGREIWRYSYPVKTKRNHGMSRTVPAVAGGFVVGLGPKCQVTCLDAESGQLAWALDLVAELGTTVPPWYAGQCPLVDGDRVILAPGGPDALLVAVDLPSGEILWRAHNPRRWEMTHSSVLPVTIGDRRAYLYCASGGVAAVAAEDGALLWESSDWRISIAAIPTPVGLGDGRFFFSGGYDAGSLMLRLRPDGEGLAHETLYHLEPGVFGATQQTPVYYEGHIYGVRPDGQLVCLTPEGQVRWTSGPRHRFGLGPFLIADGLIFVMNDTGTLTLAEASPASFELLGEAQVLEDAHDSWGPMALAGGRLIVRDLTRMRCLDMREKG